MKSHQQTNEAKSLTFTDEQLQAINSESQFVLVSAGAGSGKTTVMAERVKHLISSRGVLAEHILGLTFTRFATAELQSKVQKRIALLEQSVTKTEELLDSQPAFHTYHSFAERIFRENALRIGFEPDSIALTDVRRNQLAAIVIRESLLPLGELESKFPSILRDLLDLDDNLSNNVISTEELRNFDETLAADLNVFDSIGKTKEVLRKSAKRLILVDLVDEFRQAKRVRSVFDYADMARLALQILQKSPEVIDQYQTMYKYILLDEYQDTSVAQRELLRLLFTGGDVAITAVGDPLQAIFGFQGGNIDNILNFGTYYAPDGHESVDLTVTQRNGKNVLHLANQIGQPVRDAYPEAKLRWLVPSEKPKFGNGRVSITSFQTTVEEAESIAKEFRALFESGVAFEDMAVLARNHSELQSIARLLNDFDIPIQIRSKRALIHLPEIAEVISYLRVIAYPAANIDWLRILAGPRFALSLRDIAGIGRISQSLSTYVKRDATRDFEYEINRAIEGHDQADIAAYGDVVEFLAEHDSTEISHEALVRIRLLHEDIEYLRKYTGESLPALAQRILTVTGLGIELYAHTERLERGLGANLQAFLGMLSDFSSLQGSSSIFDFLTWLSDAERYENMVNIEIPERRGAVNVMTIHGSKGLQFRAVALPYMSHNIFPTSQTSPRWTGTASAIPHALKKISMASDFAQFPPRNRRIDTNDHNAFAQLCKAEDLLEERRLLYVALTRTEDVLMISHAYFDGVATKEPSMFFQELVEYAKSEPEIMVNDITFVPPLEMNTVVPRARWPFVQLNEEMQSIRAVATEVRDAMSRQLHISNEMTELVSNWDTAIASLIKTRRDEFEVERVVLLPESLSATDVQRLVKDEKEFIQELIRPMPKAPHFGADVGTLFHEWVENYYRQKSESGVLMALPGAEDLDQLPSDILEQAALRELIDKFRSSQWANRTPYSVEEPFTVVMNDRIVKGRIDAVFKEGDRWFLVDWKTHAQMDADPLQLSLYRIAFAKRHNISIDLVDAAFVYVRRDEIFQPETYVSEQQLTF